MLNLKVPAFDLLSEQTAPYDGFGDILPESSTRSMSIHNTAEEARSRIEEGFKRKLNYPASIPEQLDEIISEMWAHGWSPEKGNINLFATDFGLVLMSAMLSTYGGNSIFRSKDNFNHLSIWWPDFRLEAFPFHHIMKCLYHSEGNSVTSFVKALAEIVSS